MGIAEIDFIFCLRFRRNFFRHTNFLRFKISKKNFLKKFRFQVSQKNVQVVSLHTHFQAFFFIKSTKRMCICGYVKNRIGTCKNVFFLCEKRYKRITVLGSPRTYWVVRGRNKKQAKKPYKKCITFNRGNIVQMNSCLVFDFVSRNWFCNTFFFYFA